MDDLPEHPESFFVSAEEATGQVEDCIECGKVTARSRGSAGPDPSKYCLVMLNGYKHSQVSVILMLREPHP